MQVIDKFDYRFTKPIQGWPKTVKPIMVIASILGEPLMILTIGLACYISALQLQNNQAQRAFLIAALAFAICVSLKTLLHRKRPNNLKITTLGVVSYSFPSGHALGSLILFGLISYLGYLHLSLSWSLLAGLGLWSLILSIGISRVYLRAHFPSDVAGGWFLGIISLYIIVKVAF